MLQYVWYFHNAKDFSGMTILKMCAYVHFCIMGDVLITKRILVGWKFENVHLCPFMLQYGRYFDNLKILVGWKLEKCLFMSMYAAVRMIFC